MTDGSSAEDFVDDCPHKGQKKQGRKKDLSLMDCAVLIEIELLLLRKMPWALSRVLQTCPQELRSRKEVAFDRDPTKVPSSS